MVRVHLIKKLNAVLVNIIDLGSFWARLLTAPIWNFSFCLRGRTGTSLYRDKFWINRLLYECSSIHILLTQVDNCCVGFFWSAKRILHHPNPTVYPSTFIIFYCFLFILSNAEKIFSPFKQILERRCSMLVV